MSRNFCVPKYFATSAYTGRLNNIVRRLCFYYDETCLSSFQYFSRVGVVGWFRLNSHYWYLISNTEGRASKLSNNHKKIVKVPVLLVSYYQLINKNTSSTTFYKDFGSGIEANVRMPRAWLHRKSRRPTTMPTAELTIIRSNNPANEHPKFSLGDSSRVAAHRKRRLVSQNGRIKVANTNVPGKHERYFGDLFTTILDMPFHWILGIYSLAYLASWSGFGTVWFLIHYLRELHGYEDFYCVENVDSWTTAFLFSIETQTTIGYGGRQVGSFKNICSNYNSH